MNDGLAHERLAAVLELIDRWGALYDARWEKREPYHENSGLDSQVRDLIDDVRARTKFAHDVIVAMGEDALASEVVEQIGH